MDKKTIANEPMTERRVDPRFHFSLRIHVSGVNADGRIFSELCDILDISHGGISWVMETAVWCGTLLSLDFFYPHPSGARPILRRRGTARVLRVDESKDGRYAVAACFESFASFECEDREEIAIQNSFTAELLPRAA